MLEKKEEIKCSSRVKDVIFEGNKKIYNQAAKPFPLEPAKCFCVVLEISL